VIAEALVGNLAEWKGLPPDETADSLAHALAPVSEISPPREDERPASRFTVLTYDRPVAPRAVEAWFVAGSPYAALLEYDDPQVDDVDGVLAALGAPELERSGLRGADGAYVIEQVYPDRGLTLSVATPFEHDSRNAPPGSRRIVHVQLYPPTTAQRWVTEIGAGLPPRPFPP
jgi:hypothetical protein